MKYLLNSAVITAPGVYTYRLIEPVQARAWMDASVRSTIGYAETAEALSQLLECHIAVNREQIAMQPGDSALVFRLVMPPGSRRLDPQDKGSIGRAVLARHFELGLLTRTA